MKRRIVTFLGAAVLGGSLLAAAPARASVIAPALIDGTLGVNASYTTDMVTTSSKHPDEQVVKMWSAPQMVRMEDNNDHSTWIVDGKHHVVFANDGKDPMKWMRYDTAAWAKTEVKGEGRSHLTKLQSNAVLASYGIESKDLGSETVDGKDCEVSQMTWTRQKKQPSVKLWTWKDQHLPIQMEGHDQEGETSKVTYRNLKIQDVPDEMFAPPPGARIVQLTPESLMAEFQEEAIEGAKKGVQQGVQDGVHDAVKSLIPTNPFHF